MADNVVMSSKSKMSLGEDTQWTSPMLKTARDRDKQGTDQIVVDDVGEPPPWTTRSKDGLEGLNISDLDNVSLNTQPAPPMQLTDGQTSTHYEDVDASVDQGTADCGKDHVDLQTGTSRLPPLLATLSVEDLGNIDLKIEQKPSMQLTGGQAATHYEDVDRKASVVDQGSADGGKQLIDQTDEGDAATSQELNIEDTTSVTIQADQGPLVRLRDDDGITHGEPDANEKSVAQPTKNNNIEGSRQTEYDRLQRPPQKFSESDIDELGNIDLKIEQKPSMQLTGGQAATHYEDVDRKASVVDQGSADGGKQLIDQTDEGDAATSQELNIEDTTSVTIQADQGPLMRLRDDDGITHGEPDANEKSVAQPTEDKNIQGSRKTEYDRLQRPPQKFSESDIDELIDAIGAVKCPTVQLSDALGTAQIEKKDENLSERQATADLKAHDPEEPLDEITQLQQLISQSSIPGSESVVCLKAEELQIDYSSCVGKGGFAVVYNAVLLWCGKRVCVKLCLKTMLVEETIDEGILLTLLNTSGATPECYGIVSLQESNDFHPFAIVQEVINCGLKDRNTLTLEELLDPSNRKRPAPNWSALEAKLRHRLQLVHNRGVAMNDISLKNILLQWGGESYIPFFIDMGLAKYRDDPFYDPQNDWKQLEKIFEEHFPKPYCASM